MSDEADARFARRRDELHRRWFAPAAEDGRFVGAEVELLVHDGTGRPLPLLGGARSLVALLRRRAAALGWHEVPGYDDVPKFEIPGVAEISFEPGGQLEISTVAQASGSGVASSLIEIVGRLRAALKGEGVRLDSVGIDPFNDARSIPQQLPADRYRAMTTYFERIGPFGIRMMRQTAAIQISIDRGVRPIERWQLLNDLAPYLTAIFANSPRYQGQDTGHQSYRAHCWRMLDGTRTGVSRRDADPAEAYTRFALAAHDMLRADSDGNYRPFGEWESDDRSDDRDRSEARWENHLTTLFPEVRPRGHFEVRSCDAIGSEWYVVPIMLVCGLAYDERSAREAITLARDSAALLRVAGEQGLGDPSIARTARDLFQLALQGATRLGSAYFSAGDLEVGRGFYDRYTARDCSPADDSRHTDQPRDQRSATVEAMRRDKADPSLRSG